jgi:hypothetical protein
MRRRATPNSKESAMLMLPPGNSCFPAEIYCKHCNYVASLSHMRPAEGIGSNCKGD